MKVELFLDGFTQCLIVVADAAINLSIEVISIIGMAIVLEPHEFSVFDVFLHISHIRQRTIPYIFSTDRFFLHTTLTRKIECYFIAGSPVLTLSDTGLASEWQNQCSSIVCVQCDILYVHTLRYPC